MRIAYINRCICYLEDVRQRPHNDENADPTVPNELIENVIEYENLTVNIVRHDLFLFRRPR